MSLWLLWNLIDSSCPEEIAAADNDSKSQTDVRTSVRDRAYGRRSGSVG